MASLLDLLTDRVRFNRSDLEEYLMMSPNLGTVDEQSKLMNKIVKLRRSIENLQDGNLRVLKDRQRLRKLNEKLQQEVRDLDQASVSVSLMQSVAPPIPSLSPLHTLQSPTPTVIPAVIYTVKAPKSSQSVSVAPSPSVKVLVTQAPIRPTPITSPQTTTTITPAPFPRPKIPGPEVPPAPPGPEVPPAPPGPEVPPAPPGPEVPPAPPGPEVPPAPPSPTQATPHQNKLSESPSATPFSASSLHNQVGKLKKNVEPKLPAIPATTTKSDLLGQVKEGFKLKKTEPSKPNEFSKASDSLIGQALKNKFAALNAQQEAEDAEDNEDEWVDGGGVMTNLQNRKGGFFSKFIYHRF